MKRLIFFLILCILSVFLMAQSGWYWQNPYPQGNDLNAIVMNGTIGWAVGDHGTVLHSSVGVNWEQVDIGTTENLNSIYIDNISKKGWIVGNNGTVYFTPDNGVSWIKQNSGTIEPLYSVSSIGGNCPWICGNDIILKSYNEGETWEKVKTYFHQRFYAIDHIDCSEIWIAGKDGIVISTTDGGVSWKSHPSRTSRDLFSIDVVDNGDFRACGNAGVIVSSYDEGTTWVKEYENIDYKLNGIVTQGIVGESYAVGQDGIILKSLYNNSAWEPNVSNTIWTLNDVTFQTIINDKSVYACGKYGIILRKEELDASLFEIVNERSTLHINELGFVDKNKGWAVGGAVLDLQGNSKGVILQTMDGGETWEIRQNLSRALNAMDVIDENHIWAVGRDGLMIRTINGGESWGTPTSPLDGRLTSVCFVDENTGWVVTSSDWGKIIHTQNGGSTWTYQTNPTSNPLYDIFFINDNKGWAVGLDSTILMTIDGGENWKRIITNAKNGYRFASVFFIDELKGWVVGIYGSIMLTEDGGISWKEINSGTLQTLNSVYFIDEDNGWATGVQGLILRTLDGGNTWFRQYTPIANNLLSSVHFIDHLKGWVSGEGGTILNTNTGGFMHPPGSFLQDGLGLAINDNQETNSTLDLNVEVIQPRSGYISHIESSVEGYYITGLEVMLDSIIHSRVSDLTISLSHNDVTVNLINAPGNEGANFLWTRFADSEPILISDGMPPYSGNFKPENPLSAFNGLDPNGEWILSISDNVEGHEGVLKVWGLRPLFEKSISSSDEVIIGENHYIQVLQNKPNPFSGITRIEWISKKSGKTTLQLYDISGQLVKTLNNSVLHAGTYHVNLDGSKLSPGIYFYQLKIDQHSQTKKLIIQ